MCLKVSRSYRKPYWGNSDGSKQWKAEANRLIRRRKELDLSNGNQFKKISDVWSSPMEHKHGYADEPRFKRK